jgi:fused signal recognition particle receptor
MPLKGAFTVVFNFLKSSYNKVKEAFAHTGSLLGGKIRALFAAPLDANTLEALERTLYEADLGPTTAAELTRQVKAAAAQDPSLRGEALMGVLRSALLKMVEPPAPKSAAATPSPYIIMVVGVNGNGKTTSVAKLAARYRAEGKKVLVAAADTFRAAAIEQLEMWAQRLEIDIVKGAPNSDPAAVAFDAVSAGKARHADVVIIDTAGRLHTKTALMQELDKIRRCCRKLIPEAPHETLLVVDATFGQNAIEQAKIFNQFTPLDGLILTKLDGTAKGGVVIAIQHQLAIPVRYIGVGEQLDDLEPFNAEQYIGALLA